MSVGLERDSVSLAPRTIVLTGAPSLSDLQYDSKTFGENETAVDHSQCLVETFEPRISEFLHRCNRGSELPQEVPSEYREQKRAKLEKDCSNLPTWRLLRKPSHHLRSGISQRNWLRPSIFQGTSQQDVQDSINSKRVERNGSTAVKGAADMEMSFLTESSEFSSQSFHSSVLAGAEDDKEDERLSNYLDESFALFEDPTDVLSSSVVEPPASSRNGSRKSITETEEQWPYTSLAQIPPHSKIASSRAGAGARAPLVSVIAIVISVTGPKEVTIRRTGRQAQLYELLVGDESAAGFGVTIWRSGATQQADQGFQKPRQQANRGLRVDFADCPGELTRGTVIELLNIALTKFQERVYGQSQGTFRKADPMRTQIYRVNPRNGIHSRQMTPLEKRMNKQLRAVRSWWRDFTALDNDKDGRSNKRKKDDIDAAEECNKVSKQSRWLPPDESMIDE